MFAITNSTPPSIFQTYLLPALSFRRRKSSTSTTSTSPTSSASTSPTTEMPDARFGSAARPNLLSSTPSQTFLSGHTAHIACARCHADLALTSQIVSKGFTGRHGRAYLVAPSPSESYYSASALLIPPTSIANNPALLPSLPNTHTHKAVPRHLVTGLHTVCDISCALCGSILGWKYVGAEDESQKYKIGKFILETRRVLVGSSWENFDEEDELGMDDIDDVTELGGVVSAAARRASGAIVDEVDDVAFDSQDEDECEDLFAGVWSPQLARRRRNRRMS